MVRGHRRSHRHLSANRLVPVDPWQLRSRGIGKSVPRQVSGSQLGLRPFLRCHRCRDLRPSELSDLLDELPIVRSGRPPASDGGSRRIHADFSAICVVVYRQIVARAPRPRASLLAWTLLGVALLGAMSNLLSPSLRLLRNPKTARSNASPPISGNPPLLFIGLDGGTWRVLDRAMQDGSAPTLRNLVARGRTRNCARPVAPALVGSRMGGDCDGASARSDGRIRRYWPR